MTDSSKKPDELAGTEQPFVAHLVELRDRLVKAALAIAVMAIALGVYPGPGALYDLMAAPLVAHLPKGSTMIAYSVIFWTIIFTLRHFNQLADINRFNWSFRWDGQDHVCPRRSDFPM